MQNLAQFIGIGAQEAEYRKSGFPKLREMERSRCVHATAGVGSDATGYEATTQARFLT